MAEAFGLAASILGIAELGLKPTKSFIKFNVFHRGADGTIEEIEGRVSITANILNELHGIVASNNPYFKRNPTGALEAPVSSCKRDYEKLEDAIDEVKGQPKNGAASTLDKQQARMTAREKFKWAIGGEESMNELLISLKSSKDDLGVLMAVLNYGLLTRAESQHETALTHEMTEDLAELKNQLPVLVQLLQSRGLVPVDASNGNPSDDLKPSGGPSGGLPEGNFIVTPNPKPSRSPTKALGALKPTDDVRSLSSHRNPVPSSSEPSDPITSPTYEVWNLTVEETCTYARDPVGERELAELVTETNSSSALSRLSLLPPGHLRTVNKLLEERAEEYYGSREPSIVGVMPIKGKDPWWRRLTSRRKTQAVIRGERIFKREPKVVLLKSVRPRARDEVVEVRESTEEDADPPPPDAVPYSLEIEPRLLRASSTSQYGEEAPEAESALPSQEEAEKLTEKYLTRFTNFSATEDDDDEDAEDGGVKSFLGRQHNGGPSITQY